MKNFAKAALLGSLAALLTTAVSAAEIDRVYPANAMVQIASAVSVPPGYTTY